MNQAEIKISLTGKGKSGFVVHYNVVYTVNSNGLINVMNDVNFSNTAIVLARLGVRMLLSKDLNEFDYLGRGPMENYADRKSGSDIGHYASSVQQQLTPYEKHMEGGNHEDVRWARITSEKGNGLGIKSDEAVCKVWGMPVGS